MLYLPFAVAYTSMIGTAARQNPELQVAQNHTATTWGYYNSGRNDKCLGLKMERDFGEVKVRVVSSNQNLFKAIKERYRLLSRDQYPL
jgi:hypothetical protein